MQLHIMLHVLVCELLYKQAKMHDALSFKIFSSVLNELVVLTLKKSVNLVAKRKIESFLC